MCGDASFAKLMTKTGSRIEVKAKKLPHFDFSGAIVDWTINGFSAPQAGQVGPLEELSRAAAFEEHRTLCHRLVWLSPTRLAVCSPANILSNITLVGLSQNYLKSMNKFNNTCQRDERQWFQYYSLALSTLRLLAFSDFDFTNNEYLFSQLAHTIILTD